MGALGFSAAISEEITIEAVALRSVTE